MPSSNEIVEVLQWFCVVVPFIAARWWLIDTIGVDATVLLAVIISVIGIRIALKIADNHRED